ncbi:MAG: hypothetical protein KBT66_16165 [Amphritea sp.]|nr:hypothetical protein [Amphritea sp.]
MDFFGVLIVFVAWVWSVAKGIQVSMLCCILNFMFPPVSQGIFAIYEDEMRGPFIAIAIGCLIVYIS